MRGIESNAITAYKVEPAIETSTELTENGFIIRGDFSQQETYILTLTEQMKGVLGAKLPEAQTKDLYFGENLKDKLSGLFGGDKK